MKILALSLQKPERQGQGTLVSKIRKKGWASPPDMCAFSCSLRKASLIGFLLLTTGSLQTEPLLAQAPPVSQSTSAQTTNQPTKKPTKSSKGKENSAANPTQPSAPQANQPSATQSSLAKLASTASAANTETQGDYIPCKFTVPELIGLVAPEVASTLTAADEEILKQRVLSAATSQSDDRSPRSTDLDKFVGKLSDDSLSGLTPSQALNHIIEDLAFSRRVPVTAGDITKFQETHKNGMSQGAGKFFDKFATDSLMPLTKKNIPNSQLPDIAKETFPDWAKTQGEQGLSPQQAEEITKALSTIQPVDSTAIVDAARNTIGILERPPDVGCAMSILTYGETTQAYGHMIATNYIAVQIVVRNLNRDLAFVLHDVEFEVSGDVTGRLGRFYSGRDKVIVRSLSAAQSNFDPRAIFVHSAQGVGAILSAIVPIFKADTVTNATAVFNGAFVPGLDKYWKDQTADQLNLLNDTGFSSQSSSQTAVPETGTVMFVTFIPSRPFEEGWWTQPCVEKIYLGTTDKLGFVTNLATGAYSRRENKRRGQLIAGEQTGVDIARALEVCQLGYDPLPRQKKWRKKDYGVVSIPTEESEENGSASASTSAGGPAAPNPPTPPAVTNTAADNASTPGSHNSAEKASEKQARQSAPKREPNADLFRNAYRVPYKKWSSNSLAIFAELSNTVVSGAHTVEETKLQPLITAMGCTIDEKTGILIFPKPDKDKLSCTLSGKNLDKVAKLRLRNAKDDADPNTVEGTVTPTSGDSTGGTVEFPTSELRKLTQPAYSVFSVSSKGVEQRTSQTIHLSTDPSISSVSPNPVDISKDHTMTITGGHLASVDKVVLTNPDKTKKVEIPLKQDALKTDSQLLVQLDPTTLGDFGTAQTTLTIALAVGNQNYDTGQQFSFIGAAAQKPKSTNNGKKRQGQ